MSFFTLSLNFTGHDSSVALFDDDELVFFHQAERHTRKKHCAHFLTDPFIYIFYNITQKIDLLVVREDLPTHRNFREMLHQHFNIVESIIYEPLNEKHQKLFEKFGLEDFTHHSSHALSSFYMSPYDEAICLVIDAIGSGFTIPSEKFVKKYNRKNRIFGYRGFESTSIFEVSKNYNLKTLYKKSQVLPAILHKLPEGPWQSPNGIVSLAHIGGGLSNSLVNDDYTEDDLKLNYVLDASDHMDIGNMYFTITQHIGFGFHGSGKTMGLSAYGKEDPTLPEFLLKDTIYSNNNLFSHGRILNNKLYPELFGDISLEKKANLAYAAQKALEKHFLYHAEFIKNNSKIRNLIISGGCSLNILGVSLIKKHFPEFNIFVDPIGHDATHAIGEGIFFYNLLNKNCRLEKRNNFKSIYLGPKYTEKQIDFEIDEYLKKFEHDAIK